MSPRFTPTASKLKAKNSVPTEWQSKATSFGHDLQQKRCFLLNLDKKVTFDVCSSPKSSKLECNSPVLAPLSLSRNAKREGPSFPALRDRERGARTGLRVQRINIYNFAIF